MAAEGRGRRPAARCAPRFPRDWSILVVQPPGQHGLHGPDEVRAFADVPPIAESTTERLCRLVLLGSCPPSSNATWQPSARALEELQAHVGACFAPAQGGFFSSPRAVEIVEELQRAGFVGLWPELMGTDSLRFLRPSSDGDLPSWPSACAGVGARPSAVVVTRAANQGADRGDMTRRHRRSIAGEVRSGARPAARRGRCGPRRGGQVAHGIRNDQLPVVDHRPAGIDDVGHVSRRPPLRRRARATARGSGR